MAREKRKVMIWSTLRKGIRFFLPKNIDLYLYEFGSGNSRHTIMGPPELHLNISKIAGKDTTVYTATIGEQTVHRSYLFRSVMLLGQFGFNNSLVIGNCVTDPRFRGRGIYPYVLAHITNEITRRDSSKNLYIVVAPSNAPSIRGIERAGFRRIARLRGTRLGPLMLRRSVQFLDYLV